MKREGIRPPQFADQFAKIDFESDPLPVLCMFPIPYPVGLDSLSICATALDGGQRFIPWSELSDIPRITLRIPIICQIFNWSEEVEWEGIRLSDFLDYAGIETDPEGYYAIYSRDGHFFETLSRDEARDPRTLLAYGLN
ncbi:MAG TPA: molybdopterin-dependent oxidoreductase, partial [Nitrospiria bacterium]